MRVVLGITGGIAAYKATGIIRLLTEAGHEVKVVPTQNSLRFIGATTLEALSHNSVDIDLYADVESVKHVELGQSADLVIIAPATAAFLARFAAGIADDLLGNVLLATKAPVVVAPAMHTEMWQHASTQANVSTLRSRNVHILDPASGRLTGADSGEGRLPEPEEIVAFALSTVAKQDLAGKNVLITAGGTREPIDAVRFIGNSSTGKQGVALAKSAAARGANVTLIAANIEVAIPSNIKVMRVTTAVELSAAVSSELATTDLLVMAAAVADYAPANPVDHKLKKSKIGSSLTLELNQTNDILSSAVREAKSKGLETVICGFAAETATDANDLERLAHIKLSEKGADLIVANSVSKGAIFGSDSTDALIVTSAQTRAAKGSKDLVAQEILDACSDIIATR